MEPGEALVEGALRGAHPGTTVTATLSDNSDISGGVSHADCLGLMRVLSNPPAARHRRLDSWVGGRQARAIVTVRHPPWEKVAPAHLRTLREGEMENDPRTVFSTRVKC